MVVFLSRSEGLRVIRVARTQDPRHRRIVYEFAPDGMLAVEEGQDRLPDGPGGEVQDAVQWLKRHPSFGEWFSVRDAAA